MTVALWLQHALVIALAVGCAAGLVLRRLRALSKARPCDGCAQGACEPAPGRDVPIPPTALVRRR